MSRRQNPQSEENIRRIDTKKRAKKQTHGFQVHFSRGTKSVTRMFSDTVYGGKAAARKAARLFKLKAMRGVARKLVGRKPVRRRRTGAKKRRR